MIVIFRFIPLTVKYLYALYKKPSFLAFTVLQNSVSYIYKKKHVRGNIQCTLKKQFTKSDILQPSITIIQTSRKISYFLSVCVCEAKLLVYWIIPSGATWPDKLIPISSHLSE